MKGKKKKNSIEDKFTIVIVNQIREPVVLVDQKQDTFLA